MKAENLTTASDSFAIFFNELREAHKDAVHSGNDFAEIALFSLIEEAVKLQTKLNRVKAAAIQPQTTHPKAKIK